MTKDEKKDKKITEDNQKIADDEQKDELEKKLEEVQQKKIEEEKDEKDQKDEQLNVKVVELEKQLKDQVEIAKRAQHDYVNLKMDFDRMQRVYEEKSKTMDVDILISTVKKFLPFLENLRKSLITIPEAQKEDPLVK